MSELERRQTTKGLWLSKNKKQGEGGPTADNILVMDVEGTDGRERGEDQDFERKSALFALATSEVLIVNIWEHQVGLYQGANMGLLKTVFEVNLQLFLKDRRYEFITHMISIDEVLIYAVRPIGLYCSLSFVIMSVRRRLGTSRGRFWKTCPGSGNRYRNLPDLRNPLSTTTLISSSTGFRTRAISQNSSWLKRRS